MNESNNLQAEVKSLLSDQLKECEITDVSSLTDEKFEKFIQYEYKVIRGNY